jgi:hypothetical protein
VPIYWTIGVQVDCCYCGKRLSGLLYPSWHEAWSAAAASGWWTHHEDDGAACPACAAMIVQIVPDADADTPGEAPAHPPASSRRGD